MCGHWLVLGLSAFNLTFSRVGLPLGHQALGLGGRRNRGNLAWDAWLGSGSV